MKQTNRCCFDFRASSVQPQLRLVNLSQLERLYLMRQTDRHTEGHRHRQKSPCGGGALNNDCAWYGNE